MIDDGAPRDEVEADADDGLFLDADAFAAELAAQPFKVRLAGQVWGLPADAPADVMLALQRAAIEAARAAQNGDTGALQREVATLAGIGEDRLIDALIGREVWEQWARLEVGKQTLDYVIGRVVAHHLKPRRASPRLAPTTRAGASGSS
jgi:hypothetical protein